MNHEQGNTLCKVSLDFMFYLQAGDGCADRRNQLFKRETRGGEKTQISTKSKSGNTFKI